MISNKNSGFTLIELMIVIAIIAILMAYAIPAYRDFTVRAKAGEGISMSSMLKTIVSEIWANSRSVTGIDSGTHGIGAATEYVGTNVSQIEVDEGVIEVTFKNDPTLAGQTLTMTPLIPGSGGNTGSSLIWQCSSSLDNKFLPVDCRTP